MNYMTLMSYHINTKIKVTFQYLLKTLNLTSEFKTNIIELVSWFNTLHYSSVELTINFLFL